ncbi:hypothetical protein Tco_1448064 [Tanacetum coccineum]
MITKPAEVKVITYSSKDAEGMMKNYKSSRSSKVLEAVVKVLVVGIRDMVLETIFVYCLDPEDLKALMIPVMEWSGRNLIDCVDWEAERLNVISKRLNRGSVRGSLEGSLRDSLGSYLGGFMSRYMLYESWYMFITKGRFKASRSFGTSGSFGLLIARKEDLMCVETLNGWVVGFDEVLVAKSNMTKINKLMRWVFLKNNSTMLELDEALTCLLKNQGSSENTLLHIITLKVVIGWERHNRADSIEVAQFMLEHVKLVCGARCTETSSLF